ncbi:DUF7504 family protein [Halegenticoccus tardaugens]|uniref:DUF7504 family protein n=1 Tax=Halegenticoccus tardaugens TaxID=2071624 RepID=UPI00100C27C6|nr:hypothetical protein [Halegenticoccus tardaugens]
MPDKKPTGILPGDGHAASMLFDGVAGANLLCTSFSRGGPGPPCVGLFSRIEPRRQNLLAVACGKSPDALIRSWRTTIGEPPAEVGIVNVIARPRSASRASAIGTPPGRGPVTTVESMDSVDEIDASVGAYLDEWAGNGNRTALCFDSLTPMIRGAGIDATRRLVLALTRRVENADAVAHYHLDRDAHERATFDELRSLFDAVVDPSVEGERDSEREDAAFDALGSSRRRAVVRHLAAEERAVTLSDLAERVSDDERERRVTVPTDHFARVYVSLQVTHLPRLAAAGIVAIDEDRRTVRLNRTERVESCLRRLGWTG